MAGGEEGGVESESDSSQEVGAFEGAMIAVWIVVRECEVRAVVGGIYLCAWVDRCGWPVSESHGFLAVVGRVR